MGPCKRPAKPDAKPKEPAIKFLTLFKYSTAWEKFLVFSGLASAVIAGCAAPGIAIVMGAVIQIFGPDATPEDVQRGMV